jgi:uncharacterized protein (TIGR02466 family)
MNSYQFIFPTPIAIFNLNRELHENEKEEFNKIFMDESIGNSISIEKYILEKENFVNLKKDILNLINTFINEIYQPVSNNISPYITQSWLNKTKQYEFHHAHTHQNSFLSCVLYLENEKNVSNYINFQKLNCEQIHIASKNFELNQIKSIKLNKHDILIFPSSLPHYVPMVTDDITRTSLAFNIFLKGNLGTYHHSNELILK